MIGRYYAAGEGMDPVIADAIRDHYKPQGPGDAVPSDAVGATVALADKLDTLIAFLQSERSQRGREIRLLLDAPRLA